MTDYLTPARVAQFARVAEVVTDHGIWKAESLPMGDVLASYWQYGEVTKQVSISPYEWAEMVAEIVQPDDGFGVALRYA